MSSDLNFVEKQYQKRMSFWCVGLSSYLSSSSAQDEFYDFQRVSRGYFPNTLYKGIPVFSSSFCCDCQPLSEQWGNKKNRTWWWPSWKHKRWCEKNQTSYQRKSGATSLQKHWGRFSEITGISEAGRRGWKTCYSYSVNRFMPYSMRLSSYGCLKRTREAGVVAEKSAQHKATLASSVPSKLLKCIHNSIYACYKA